MPSELEKIIVTMEANNASLLKKIEQNNKSLNTFKGKTEKALGTVDKAFVRTGKVAVVSGAKVGRSFKGAAGQLGYQVQDIAVQLQAGQNAMLIFGQQGSQIASIFGPGGAVIGAVLAVTAALGSALVPQLFKTENAAEELEKAFKKLNETLDKNEDGIYEYTKAFKLLAKESKDAAKVRILANQEDAIDAAKVAVKALRDELGQISGFSNKFNIPIQELGELIRLLNSPIKTKDDLFRVQEILNKLAVSGKAASPEFIRLADSVNVSVLQIKDLDKILLKLKNTTSAALDFNSIADLEKVTKDRLSLIKKMVTASGQELNAFIKQIKAQEKAEAAFNQRISGALGQAFPEDAKIEQLRSKILDLNLATERSFNDGNIQQAEKYQMAIAELEAQISKITSKPLQDALSQAFPNESRIVDLESKIGTLKDAIDNAIDSGDVEAAERYREAIGKISEQVDALDPMKSKIKELGASLDDALTDGLSNAIAGVEDWEKQFIASIANILIQAAALKFIGPSGTSGAGSGILKSLFSFDGGGFTGPGPRSGGIDGKGGFPAILHPNETVVDHTQGQTAGNTINVMVKSDNPGQFIKAQSRIAYETRMALGVRR